MVIELYILNSLQLASIVYLSRSYVTAEQLYSCIAQN
jgi:hypothetical protein